jgi:hypothetical protein
MDLLKELPFNFRWYLLYTKTKEIIILYYKSASDLQTEDEETILESTYFNTILAKYEIIESVKRTRNENENTINEFNSDIVEFCNKHPNSSEIRFINTQYTHSLMFESKVFASFAKASKKLYFELGNSAIRIDNDSYEEFEKIEFTSGYLFPDSNTEIYCKNVTINNIDINCYNNSEEVHSVSFIISEAFNASNIALYDTCKLNIVQGSKNETDFENSKVFISYLKIYGQEFVDLDSNTNRISILGINKVNIGEIEVEEAVKYGNILKINNIVTFTLGRIIRTITEVKNGSFVTVGGVGTVNIHDINYFINSDSKFKDDTSLIYFLKDSNSGLKRSINLYNSIITNDTDKKINIFKLPNLTVNKIFISSCTINDNVEILKMDDDSKITKLSFTDCDINCENFNVTKCDKLTLSNCNFNIIKKIDIKTPFLIINDGVWKFDELSINYDSLITKISTEHVEFDGNILNIDGSNSDLNGSYFDNGSKINVKNINIKGMIPSFLESCIHTANLTCTCDRILKLNHIYLFFRYGDITLNINSSVTGKIIIGSNSEVYKLNINISDIEKRLNINDVEFIGTDSFPTISTTTNTPIRFDYINSDNKRSYLSFTNDYNSKQMSSITYTNAFKPVDFKLINNSEKNLELIATKDEYGSLKYECKKI